MPINTSHTPHKITAESLEASAIGCVMKRDISDDINNNKKLYTRVLHILT